MRDSVRRFFDDHSEAWRTRYYRRDFDSVSYQDRMREAFRLLGRYAGAGLRVLDVGCGAGVQAGLLRRLGHDVFACDVALEMSRQAGQQIGGRAVVAVAERLPFAPDSFDAVIALGVIGYSTDPEAFLQSMQRVLRPGGLLVISSANERLLLSRLSAHISRWPNALYRWIKVRLCGRPLPVREEAMGFYRSHYNYLDARDFDRMLRMSGFERLHGSGINFGQLQFMGKPIMGEAASIGLSRALTRLARGLPLLQRFARIYVAAARRPATTVAPAASQPFPAEATNGCMRVADGLDSPHYRQGNE